MEIEKSSSVDENFINSINQIMRLQIHLIIVNFYSIDFLHSFLSLIVRKINDYTVTSVDPIFGKKFFA